MSTKKEKKGKKEQAAAAKQTSTKHLSERLNLASSQDRLKVSCLRCQEGGRTPFRLLDLALEEISLFKLFRRSQAWRNLIWDRAHVVPVSNR
jgi:hypothetical protein